MHQQLRFGNFLQGGPECCDQLRGQLLNKPYGVCEQHLRQALYGASDGECSFRQSVSTKLIK